MLDPNRATAMLILPYHSRRLLRPLCVQHAVLPARVEYLRPVMRDVGGLPHKLRLIRAITAEVQQFSRCSRPVILFKSLAGRGALRVRLINEEGVAPRGNARRNATLTDWYLGRHD